MGYSSMEKCMVPRKFLFVSVYPGIEILKKRDNRRTMVVPHKPAADFTKLVRNLRHVIKLRHTNVAQLRHFLKFDFTKLVLAAHIQLLLNENKRRGRGQFHILRRPLHVFSQKYIEAAILFRDLPHAYVYRRDRDVEYCSCFPYFCCDRLVLYIMSFQLVFISLTK